jgi:TonB family protein
MKPAPVSLESISNPDIEATPAPAFLVDLPPWHQVFLRNLEDLFRPAKHRTPEMYAHPGSFWTDVFVSSRLPWKRFAQSAVCHIAFIAALWASVRFWPQKPQVLDRPVFNRADVIYYSPSEYLPPLDTGGARRPLPQKGEPEHASQPIISVPAEADNRTQTIVTPSDIKLTHDVPLPNIVAWSQNPAQPTMPLASTAAANRRLPSLPLTAVAPAPETMPGNHQRSPMLSESVVAPAPDVNAESSRTLRAPQAAVVEPPPSVDASSSRRIGDINIGHSQVVAPAPELPVAEQYAGTGRAHAALGGGAGAAVPPPPSISGNAGANSNGRIISLGIHPAAMSDAQPPVGNRRGTFAATPAGKTGAPGTPDIAANANRNSGNGAGSGKNSAGIPSGLTVGAGPDNQNRSAVAGPGNGTGGGTGSSQSSDNTRLMADATPPRVTSTPHALSEVAKDKVTDVDRWIFGDKKFYAMTLNMPNLNSGGGSWIIRFAELNPNEAKGDLTAPQATQKVDPAYPLELMRRNVQGTVTLYAIIRNDGSVSDIRVLRGVDDQLDQYARTAFAHWHFRPATKNGAAVDLEAVVVIPFKPARGKSGF